MSPKNPRSFGPEVEGEEVLLLLVGEGMTSGPLGVEEPDVLFETGPPQSEVRAAIPRMLQENRLESGRGMVGGFS